jgi:hypothetical protein
VIVDGVEDRVENVPATTEVAEEKAKDEGYGIQS